MIWRDALWAAPWTAALGIFLASALAAFAREPAPVPTPIQIAACTPDALRLCGHAVPDPEAVKVCMLLHRRQLSQQCREAFK